MERKACTARRDLDEMLVDETAEPKALPLSLLEDITGDFSDDQEIGSGGFAVVYKGILGDRAVAVKRLSNALMDETKFHREVECLMRVKHKNVVRFLGYCADRQGNMERYDGKLVMADVHHRLLCFEYIPKGSLDKYIIDAYREWGTCYKIIKGICEGLQYLHENHIIHLDLKPANILLDDNMIPKITDFGLSRCFDENQSRDITKTILGTMGYLAPELREGGLIARSADLYSLGVIIIELLTAQKGYQAIEHVLESWSDRLERSQRDTLCEQIRVCYETALECRDFNPKKRPASARDIIDRLHEMESIQRCTDLKATGACVHGLGPYPNPPTCLQFSTRPTLCSCSPCARGTERRRRRNSTPSPAPRAPHRRPRRRSSSVVAAGQCCRQARHSRPRPTAGAAPPHPTPRRGCAPPRSPPAGAAGGTAAAASAPSPALRTRRQPRRRSLRPIAGAVHQQLQRRFVKNKKAPRNTILLQSVLNEIGMDELHDARKGKFPSKLDARNNNVEVRLENSRFKESHDCGSSQNMLSNVDEGNEALDECWNIIQMIFESEEDCYRFYNSYAMKKGFSIRKETVRREKKVGDIYYRRFVCSKEGIRDPEVSNIKDRKRRERANTRENCRAELSIRLDMDRGVCFVDNFVDEHNHNLTSPDETPFLRSHRKIKDHQKSEIVLMESMGIRKHVMMDVMECKHGGYDKVGFVRKNIYNFSSRYKRSRIVDDDANAALGIMKARQEKDPDFVYEYQLDKEGRLTNLFWCDAQSRMDYQSFGDVVIFDSTYRMNRYKMPFVPFVGLNHHRQTTIFACGIVSDECVASYTWLLSMFLKAMCQQKPESIITDSDNAMMKAIRQILPNTNHRVCSWHIEKGIKKHLHHAYISIFRSFIYDACSPADFTDKWNAFVEKYQTNRNRDWLNRMYRKRRLWAATFLYDKFFLGMRTNQRSESLNSRLHRHLDNYMSLVDLLEHYEVCVSGMRRREAEFDCRASQSWPIAGTDSRELEESAGHVFTSANFDLVQEELKELSNFDIGEVLHDGNSTRYILMSKEAQGGTFSVDNTCPRANCSIKCSCRKMECEGIPCKHILCVLKHLEMTEMPKCCVLQRLSKDAKGGLPSLRKSDLHVWTEKQVRYHELSTLGSELFDLASNSHDDYSELKEYFIAQISEKKNSSNAANVTHTYGDDNDASGTAPKTKGSVLDPTCVVTKGAPRGRMKSFDDRRPRLCSVCRKSGHDIRRCPEAMQEE